MTVTLTIYGITGNQDLGQEGFTVAYGTCDDERLRVSFYDEGQRL